MGDYSHDGEEPTSRTERIARAETAQAVIQGLMLVLAIIFVIMFLIQFYKMCTKCPGTAIAEFTKVVSYRETTLIDNCDIADACSTLRRWNGTLVLLADTATTIGTSLASCFQIAVDPVDSGDLYLCNIEYTFDGSGSVTAGTMTASGSLFLPTNSTDVTAWRTSTWAVTGGTGAVYYKPNGGQVVFTTAADQATMDGTITFPYVA